MADKRRVDAAVLIRMTRAEKERLDQAIPKGSLNAVGLQLLLDYCRELDLQQVVPVPQGGTAA